MSLRTRLTLAGGGAVFVALAIASLVIYVDVRSKLHDQIDVSLIQSAEGVASKWVAANAPPPPGKKAGRSFGKDASGLFQIIPSIGAVTNGVLSGFIPLIGRDKAVASGVSPPYFRDVRFAKTPMRVYTMRLPSSSAGLVRTVRPLHRGERDDHARPLAAVRTDARRGVRGGPPRVAGGKRRAAPCSLARRRRSRGECDA